jgi:tripartite-type tricarboxylate transporter receptor subunit TctC
MPRIGSMIMRMLRGKIDVRLGLLRSVIPTVAVTLITLSGHGAWSQTTRTIKIVVTVPPGGGEDILARLLGEQISRAHGLTILIENRPGAGGVIGVSRAVPDGSTLLMISGGFVINPHLRKVNYDPLTSFEPICQLVSVPPIFAVNSASPHRTLADLLNAARAKPGDLTLATTTGSVFHIGFEMLKRAAKVDMILVPYPGAAPAVNALLGEHVTSVFYGYPGMVEQLKSGRLRALATASRTRIASLRTCRPSLSPATRITRWTSGSGWPRRRRRRRKQSHNSLACSPRQFRHPRSG